MNSVSVDVSYTLADVSDSHPIRLQTHDVSAPDDLNHAFAPSSNSAEFV